MNTLQGSMIELNVHMQTRGYANSIIFIGIVLILASFACLFCDLKTDKKFKITILCYLAVIAIGFGLWIYGSKIPKDKIISYCANGPISIEQISAAYYIVEIDGKLIRLKERR